MEIGRFNDLEIVKKVDFGFYLDGGAAGEILLPRKYAARDAKVGDTVHVFVYYDSEDRIIATTETPLAQVGEFACLQVAAVNRIGAFLNWGLSKDLLVPFAEQKQRMQKGHFYVVRVTVDERSNRIIATSKLDRFLDFRALDFGVNDEVDLLIFDHTELGYKAIINDNHSGVLYENEVFQPLHIGQKIKGYIKKIREDEKIDLTLHKPGFEKVEDFSDILLKRMEDNNGFLPLNDKSSPEVIYEMFGVSKKTFKKTLGKLYADKRIVISDEGIKLSGH